MDKNELEKILENQEILNKKLDIIIQMLHQKREILNTQMVIQGLALGDLMRLDR